MALKQRPRRAPKPPAGDDVALICGVSASGTDVHILRRRNNRIEAGVARALREGEPIHGEVVKLTPREESPLLCDVEVQIAAPEAGTAPLPETQHTSRDLNGPPQVSSESYRRNWDAIWSRSPSNKRFIN